MQASKEVRAARKTMQLRRLEKKGDDDYNEYYRNQPLQKVKAARNAEIAAARGALIDAREALAVAQVTGEGLKASQERHAIASLVVQKLEAAGHAPRASLTAG
ncbi:MAG: hypothetical protein V3S69_01360 [Dehalococcoidales bacterium]